ncbi:MAG: outer membrane beta-barrel protein [Gammaproteobacteria bacterium]
MKTIRVVAIGLMLGMGLSSVAVAQGFDNQRLFFGAGVSSNEVSGSDSSVGFQIFGGYGFGEVTKNVFIDAEVGYLDTGTMKRSDPRGNVKANGLWANGVGRLMVARNVELIGRLGLDFGDDDGLMAGVGVGFLVSKSFKLRLEYVQRDDVNSVQFNFVYQP